MNVYEAQNIRNLAFLGHSGSGKTTLAEALLFQTGSINRRGTSEDGNTQSDYNEIEQERGCSIFATPLFTEWNNLKINIIDTPGYDDYIGEILSALHIADSGVMVLNAQNGIEVASEIVWQNAAKVNKPMMIAVNKLDVDQANFDKTVEEAKNQFGHGVTVFQYPLSTGAGFDSIIDIISMSMYKFSGEGTAERFPIPDSEKSKVESIRSEFIESIAETDEELMTKYFDEGDLSEEDLNKGLKKAIISRQIFPIFCFSSKKNIGTELLLNFIKNAMPSPVDMPAPKDETGNDIPCNANGQLALFVFKLFSDPRVGDMTFFKVYSGKLNSGMDLVNEQRNQPERFGQIFAVSGKKRIEATALLAGDIGATVKLKVSQINHTIHEKGYNIVLPAIKYPNPKVRTAVVPKTKGEEEKVGMGLHNLCGEDPSLQVLHSQELRQIILMAQGELHLGVAKWRLEHRYKVEAEFIEPRVPYRETIQKQVRSSYRHKKQTGGAGQFAEVHMMIEPWREDLPYFADFSVRGKELIDLEWGGKLEYVNCIVGGVIDQRFMPAILKGVMDKMQFGPLTGCYVRDIRIYIHDGKMHPVDSNEAAFKTAGMMAFKDCFVQAAPKILEPIYMVEIKVPEDYVGDVMSDLPTRRSVILGIESEGRYQTIKARMPLAELDKYSTGLRAMTQGRATYNSEFTEYQAVPPNVQQDLIDAYKKSQEEE